jgi:predicted Ser/Thr protein kinase
VTVLPVETRDVRIPTEIGDCPVLGVLGEGGQSVVYRGWHPRLKTEIAIKKLRAAPDSAESALVHEGLILSSVKSPALPRPLDLRQVGDEWFLLLELIHGEPLTDCGLRLNARQIVKVLRELLVALTELHKAQLLHLDLTPANVLIDENGDARLIDFGLARRGPAVGDGEHLVGGTPGFVAPEVFDRAVRVDERADVYGAGALLHFLLFGDAPHASECSELRPGLDGDPVAIRLGTVCDTAIQADRKLRFQSAEEFLRAVDEVVGRRSMSRRWLAAGALVGTLLLGNDQRLLEPAHAEVLVVRPEGDRPLREGPQLRLGDHIAFAFDAGGASAGLMVRTPSGAVIGLEPFKRGRSGAFRYPPNGGTLLRQERGTYVVFFSTAEAIRARDRLVERLRRLPPPPMLKRGESLVLSRNAENSLQSGQVPEDARAWAEAFVQCEREFSGLVAIAFPVE